MSDTMKKAPPRRVTWEGEDLTAMTLLAFGISPQVVAHRTGLTVGQVQYRSHKGNVRCTDWRLMRPRTVGREIAAGVLDETMRRYSNVVSGHLQRSLPTKRESRQPGHNGHAP